MADSGVQWLVGTPPFLSNALKIAWKWAKKWARLLPFFLSAAPEYALFTKNAQWSSRSPFISKLLLRLRKSTYGQSEHSYSSSLDCSITGRRNGVQIHDRLHHVFSSKTLWSFIFIFVGLSDQIPSDYRTVGIRNRRTFGALDYINFLCMSCEPHMGHYQNTHTFL